MKEKDALNFCYTEGEISDLIEENIRLSNEVKRLVKTEYSLYNTQVRLDNQIELYKALYYIGKKFTNIKDMNVLFNEMGIFILEELNYGSYVIMENIDNHYKIIAKRGDFDDNPDATKTEFEPVLINKLFEKLNFNDQNYSYCDCPGFSKYLGMKNFVVFVLDSVNSANPKYLLFVGNPKNDEFFSQIYDNDIVIIGLCNLVGFVLNAMNNICHYCELVNERESLEIKVNERTKDLDSALQELKRLNQKLHDKSLNDELTGLYNRRGFFTLGHKLFEASIKNRTPIFVVFCDLDGLKRINDTYGHKEGDFAIKQAGLILKKAFRKNELISRFGGDEYVVLAANVTEDYIHDVIKQLNYHFNKFNECSGKSYTLSISIGFSASNYEVNTSYSFEELIDKADKKLYSEKKRKSYKEAKEKFQIIESI